MKLRLFLLSIFAVATCAAQGGFYEMAATLASASGGDPIQVSDHTNNTSHDAEQTPGGVLINSTDLELNNGGSPSTVGLWFDNLNIPAGATIQSAYVSFQSQKNESATPVSVTIVGEASASPNTFGTGANDIYSRSTTTASVAWNNIPAWSLNERSADTETPDISAIIQEIVDAGYYTQGDPIVIIFQPGGGTVRRRGHDFNVQSEAPTITITYTN